MNRLLILRIAKCATTTIVGELERQVGTPNVCHIDRLATRQASIQRLLGAMNRGTQIISVAPLYADWFYSHGLDTAREAGYKVVSFQRNPYARFISSWAFVCQRPTTFKEPLPLQMSPYDLSQVRDYQLSEVQWAHTFQEQTTICRPSKVDHILQVERLGSCFNRLAKDCGYNQRKLPTRNESSHAPWEWYYQDDPRLLEEVQRRFPRDTTRLKDVYDAPE